jgi:hypothetical protein
VPYAPKWEQQEIEREREYAMVPTNHFSGLIRRFVTFEIKTASINNFKKLSTPDNKELPLVSQNVSE